MEHSSPIQCQLGHLEIAQARHSRVLLYEIIDELNTLIGKCGDNLELRDSLKHVQRLVTSLGKCN